MARKLITKAGQFWSKIYVDITSSLKKKSTFDTPFGTVFGHCTSEYT